MPRIARGTIHFFATLLLFVPALFAHAQTPILEEPGYTPTLTFDIAVIRQAPPPDANFHVSVSSPPHSSRFDAKNLPLKTLIQIAYGYDAPIVGAPDWTANTFYNILAYSDATTDARLAKLTDNEVRLEKRNAIRVLLADRLGLKTHFETRNSAIYNLTVAKGGVKMQPVPALPPDQTPTTPPPANVQTHPSQHGLEFVGSNASMRAITALLSTMAEAPVADKTGLTGTFNYTLQIGREWSERDPDTWPSIFTAVQEQLGLKLDAVHESVPNLMIDHITKPTDN
jgi:uncharacterized protein (TIGR03435 family)